jgi:hypothetical protein
MNKSGEIDTRHDVFESRVVGHREVALPRHMAALPQHSVDFLYGLPDRSTRVMAAGVDPRDSSLTMITLDLEVRTLRPNGRLVPTSAVPSDDGRFIGVEFVGGDRVYSINAAMAVSRSEDAMKSASLHVNDTYMSDLEIDSAVHVDGRHRDEDQIE